MSSIYCHFHQLTGDANERAMMMMMTTITQRYDHMMKKSQHDACRYDEHWRPVSVHCSPCNFPFTHIIHFESLQVDGLVDMLERILAKKPRCDSSNFSILLFRHQAEERLFLKELGKKEFGSVSRFFSHLNPQHDSLASRRENAAGSQLSSEDLVSKYEM